MKADRVIASGTGTTDTGALFASPVCAVAGAAANNASATTSRIWNLFNIYLGTRQNVVCLRTVAPIPWRKVPSRCCQRPDRSHLPAEGKPASNRRLAVLIEPGGDASVERYAVGNHCSHL
jgi:hypothetical protein